MAANLLRETWAGLDSFELRLLLHERIGGPGQYDGFPENPNKLYLPLARESCRIGLTFDGNQIVTVDPGPAFDAAEWERISEEIEASILAGPTGVGRAFSFSGFRVLGSWRGKHSGVQILPPPDDAPRAPEESADHPFILEFPIRWSEFWPVTNHRLSQGHRRFTLLLSVLLAGHMRIQSRRPQHFWAVVLGDANRDIKWVGESFSANLGDFVLDALSPPVGAPMAVFEPEAYYAMRGNDGKGLRVPADLDEAICRYQALSPERRVKFDRAAFWVDVASRQWAVSVSSSFAALVSAIESLEERGTVHQLHCDKCGAEREHEVPGATRRFRDFLERYAPGPGLRETRDRMWGLRSAISHGSTLMQIDQDLVLGWDPPWWHERELHDELWILTRVALRNWLKDPSGSEDTQASHAPD